MKKYLLAIALAALICVAPHAQNGAYLQGPLTVTNGAVVQPSLCGDTGTCPGTPAWASDPTITGIQWIVTGGALNYTYSCTPAGVCATPTAVNGMLANGGSVLSLQNRANLLNLKMIATSSTNATVWITVVRP